MQKIELHPTSLIAGAVLAVLAFVAMAPAPPPSTQPTPPGLIPARSMIQIKQGTPYTVPAGQLLVITAVGSLISNTAATLSVNGVAEIVTYPAVQSFAGSGQGTDNLLECRSIVPVPPGFAIQQGSVVTVTGAAWGYIERY